MKAPKSELQRALQQTRIAWTRNDRAKTMARDVQRELEELMRLGVTSARKALPFANAANIRAMEFDNMSVSDCASLLMELAAIEQ